MKLTIARDTVKLDYQNGAYWKQFDEIEVEEPTGWYIRYVERGIVHSFGYSQSSGRGEYLDEYRETVHKFPLPFSSDAKANAQIMHKTNYDDKDAVLIRESKDKS